MSLRFARPAESAALARAVPSLVVSPEAEDRPIPHPALGLRRRSERAHPVTTNELREFFNAKASPWHQKYSAEGPLAFRVPAFIECIRTFLAPPGKVLDLGCGTGALAVHLAREGYVVSGCDIAEGMLSASAAAYPDEPVERILLSPSWNKLPFPPGKFDAIVSSSVFEYVEDVETVLRECTRVLRPGGRLLLTAPNPANATRRLEKIIRPLAVASLALPGYRVIPKIGRYLEYLRLSRNRFTVEQWHALGAVAGLRPAPAGRQFLTPPLMFVQFAKAQAGHGGARGVGRVAA